ncbi:MAG: MmgE/PrpD family protein [Gammaproteobacteria bacterium]|nr:MmgE/PrpD family protein [Gammaproteobacteria bacterium]
MSLSQNLIKLIRQKPINQSDLDDAALFALDALATAYAGSKTPVGACLLNWAKNNALDDKRRVFLSAALTHITETDDLHRASVTHPGCVVVPTALMLGERCGASPTKILSAILQGFEAMCRIGASVGPTHYKVWHNTATCGPFGSAMAAACLLDLTDEQALHAMGNAGTQSSGFWQFMDTGAMSKHLHAGHASEAGLLAAELAISGFSGPPQILEGEKGFYAGMCTDPDPEAVLALPQDPWQLGLTSIKPWPSCRHTHPSIDCALELHNEIKGAAISSVSLSTYQAALDVCDRPNPESEYQAKFSLYHCIAIALLNGEVTLSSFGESARQQSAQLRDSIHIMVTSPFASAYPQNWGSALEVTLMNGRVLNTSRKNCKGDPELALSQSEMRSKASGLLEFGGLQPQQASQLCDDVLSLSGSSSRVALFGDFISFLELS